MPDEKKKIQLSIYKIDMNSFSENGFEEVVDTIITVANKDESFDSKYELQALVKEYQDYQIKIFHAVKKSAPKWKSFLKDVVDKNSALSKSANKFSSFVAFIEHKDHLFAISGGQGNFILQGFAEHNFGTEVLVRLIKKEDKVIKSLQDRGVAGSILGQTKFYRGEKRLSDEDQFGKIYKQVKADLDKKILTEIFGFPANDLKRNKSGCYAKSSFQINKSINFETLLKIISKFTEILAKDRNFSLNKVYEIENKGQYSKVLIEKLNETLITSLYNSCLANEVPDFDFCHKDFEAYYSASSFTIKFNGKKILEYEEPVSLKELINDLKKERFFSLEDIDTFKHSFLFLTAETKDDNDIRVTNGTVLEHLHGEIFYEGKTYFYIDDRWYEIHPDFIEDLNVECRQILDQVWNEELIRTPFNLTHAESRFNQSFIGMENHLVFDTVTPENIEVCDIMKFDNETVHLIHVKKGFDNSIRDLASQISIAASRIYRDIKAEYTYLDLLEDETRVLYKSKSEQKKNLGNQKFPKGGLKELFKSKLDRNITFCLAFVDTAKKKRSLKNDLDSYNSNIAKYSLINLKKEIGLLGFDFKIIQLNKISS